MTRSSYRRLDHKSAPRRLGALVRVLIGTPRAAKRLKVLSGPRAATLGGRRAERIAFTYRYHGRQIVQRDIVTSRGRRLYWVELDVGRSQARSGQRALNTVRRGWRWR